MKMYGHKLSIWIPIMVLLSCSLYLVNTYTVIICGQVLNSAGIPTKSPKTNVGSYMVHQDFRTIMHRDPIRDIYIYWKEIDNREKCGNSFEYDVTCSPTTIKDDDNKTVIIPWKIIKKSQTNYIKFEGLSTRLGFKFNVFSSNEQGLSKEFSTIHVPTEMARYPKLFSLTRMHLSDGKYELSWNNHEQTCNDDLGIEYTIYWCENNMYRYNECHGHINWVDVPCTVTAYNITVKEKYRNYNFAISEKRKISLENAFIMTNSNTSHISSGMVWESCKIHSSFNKILAGKIEKIKVNAISSEDVQLHWTLECTKITVLGYRIFYCQMPSNRYINCTENSTVVIIDLKNPYEKNAVIFKYDSVTALVIYGLQPLTTYQIIISVISDDGEGSHSNPIFVTTKQKDEYHNSKTGGRIIPYRIFKDLPRF